MVPQNNFKKKKVGKKFPFLSDTNKKQDKDDLYKGTRFS